MDKIKVIFLDRDGTIIEETESGVIDSIADLRFLPKVVESLQKLKFDGYHFVMVTNQPGLGKGRVNPEGFEEVQKQLIKLFAMDKVFFDEIFVCPHLEEEQCNCKKPKIGMVKEYIEKNDIALDRSFVIGDRSTDVGLAKNLGIKSIRMSAANDPDADFTTNSWKEVADFILDYSF
ncbi:histidinol-phosphatase [candidate division WWE3 bacterium RIFOXYD1_FULL_39_9]|uniref:D,D-heptose 1,7-bisphosphate phosphatase n=1 Tax=candidate division WWE3 bacterium RIFOXYD1_FULL_39_9 TaxID=1802649 RepID=A0A1F4X387_UNCKA|nr:MAG: histidinol-phosphatase [candidate division WWE3 bacterium RIFOXYD1_FULL_39_9]